MLIEEGATAESEVLDVPEVEVDQTERSMEDTIRETLHSLKEKGVTPDVTEAPEDDVEKAARIRDEKGKFKAKEAVAEVAADPVAEIEQPVIKPAPNTWKKEAQAEWQKLPPAVQAEVERREADFHKGIEQYRNKAQFAETMERTLTPYMATINGFGVTPDVAVGELLKADHALRYGNENQKVGMVFQIFKDYGISPQAVFDQLQNGVPQVDPQVDALQQRLQQLEGTLQQQQQLGKQQEQESLNSAIAQFAADPTHSHFESVKGHMSALLQAGQAQDLKDAYEQAVWANPTTRSALIAEQQKAQRDEATQKAQAAKAAASINVTRRPALPPSQPIGSMDDTIRSTLRRLQGS